MENDQIATRLLEIERRTAVLELEKDDTWLHEEPFSSSGGGDEGSSTGCFDVKEIDEEERTVTLTNCYYAIGGTTYCADDQSVGVPTDGGFIALVVSMSPSDFGTASVTAFSNFTALQNESKDSAKYVKPLYRIGDEGAIDLDMRNMPQLAAGEMVT